MVYYPADSSALMLSEWSTGTHQMLMTGLAMFENDF